MTAPKTQFLTNDALTRKKWANDLFISLLPASEYSYLVGKGSDSIVQLNTDLTKGAGDAVTFGIRKALTGEGIVGNETLEGNEEELSFADFKITVEERQHAVDTGGKMEEQRVPYNLVQEGKTALQDWWVDDIDKLVINTLTSNTGYKVRGSYFANDIAAPDAKHHMTVNDVTEANITDDGIMDLSFFDRAKQRAELMNREGKNYQKIRPLRLNGKSYYRAIVPNYCFDALRQNTNAAQWGDILRNAQKLQMPEVEIEYNGVLISKSERCPNMYPDSDDSKAGVYRGVLLGAQAGCIAWGGAGDSKGTVMSFTMYNRDANRYLMIRGGGIYGVKKTRFDGFDYGAIVLSGWGAPLD